MDKSIKKCMQITKSYYKKCNELVSLESKHAAGFNFENICEKIDELCLDLKNLLLAYRKERKWSLRG